MILALNGIHFLPSSQQFRRDVSCRRIVCIIQGICISVVPAGKRKWVRLVDFKQLYTTDDLCNDDAYSSCVWWLFSGAAW